MGSARKVVWAAGGVLWRRGRDGIEVAVVHRPRYDDWSLPKGKAEPGELLVSTAARELVEETGYDVRIGHRLQTVEYRLHSGALKKVGYWAVAATGGEFVPNHECDALRWLSIDAARKLVSYSADRKVLRTFGALPVDELHTFLLVRHAKAGRRSRFHGDDRDRPLDAQGRVQAAALESVLGLFGAHSLHAADRVRCVQTLQPLADALRGEIVVEPLLTEESFAHDRDATYARIRELAAEKGPVRVVCSQGGVIPPVVEHWADDDGVQLPPSRNRKGGFWVLTTRAGALVDADYHPSPLPD